MSSTYIKLPAESGGGPAAGVDSFNGRTGVVVSQSGDYGASNISNTPAGTIAATDVQTAINELDSEKQAAITGTNGKLVHKNSSGDVESYETIQTNIYGGLRQELDDNFGDAESHTINDDYFGLIPTENSPSTTINARTSYVDIDPDSSGFDFGTSGTAVRIDTVFARHIGTSDVGGIALRDSNFEIGNGTDPIDVEGLSYSYGFGTINSNVNLSGPLQGYGFQPSANSSATISSSTYVTAFYDASNLPVQVPSYRSFNASPNVGSVANNHNMSGFNANPTIGALTGNAGYTGLGLYPNITTIGSGGVKGVDVSLNLGTIPSGSYMTAVDVHPSITLNKSFVTGLDVNMSGVTNYAGVQSSLVVQDITYTLNQPGDNNNITVEYTDTTTAGNEVASFSYPAITVSIESGVSTATQVWNAIQANFTLISNVTAVITGTGSNAQVTQAATNMTGGEAPGTARAINVTGDVSINGALTFTGALSIGQLNSFASVDISAYPSGVNSLDTLITSPTVADNTTLSTDILAVNTAMLLSVGDNCTLTSSFLGYTALGLPAVVSMGTGSTIDRVTGATFAISLDATATGGSIAEVDLCRAVAIPNGVTSVSTLKGFTMDLPFGSVSANTFGVHISPEVNNYMAGSLKIGTTDAVSNSSVALEIESTTKAFLPSRMSTAQRDAMTAINGMVIYNTSTDKLQVYAAGSWVDLH